MKSTIFIAGVFVALVLSLAYMTMAGDRHAKHRVAQGHSDVERPAS
jgi:preprotein translocase subunit SecG